VGPKDLPTGKRLTPANKQKPLGDFPGRLSFFGTAGFPNRPAAAHSKGEFDAQNF
jgi:hypothetical protein